MFSRSCIAAEASEPAHLSFKLCAYLDKSALDQLHVPICTCS